MEQAEQALRLAAISLLVLNETCFVPRLWIVSNPPPTWPSRFLVSPLTTTITYALSEPIWTALLLCSPHRKYPVPAFAVAFCGFCHLIAACMSSLFICDWMHIIPRRLMTTPQPPPKPPQQPSEPPDHQTAPKKPAWIYPVFLVPVQTAAMSNAAFIIWTHDLGDHTLPSSGSSGVDLVVNILLGLLSYIGFALVGDSCFGEISYRAIFFRKPATGGGGLYSQLGYLAILLVLRLCARKMLGVEVWPALSMLVGR